ncbi:MAG: hypothetical protein F6K28_24060 [Microcoleus sp. SIO2G3]|nr:hypothetical protein [Microcoleus sp. SIO2G3]
MANSRAPAPASTGVGLTHQGHPTPGARCSPLIVLCSINQPCLSKGRCRGTPERSYLWVVNVALHIGFPATSLVLSAFPLPSVSCLLTRSPLRVGLCGANGLDKFKGLFVGGAIALLLKQSGGSL